MGEDEEELQLDEEELAAAESCRSFQRFQVRVRTVMIEGRCDMDWTIHVPAQKLQHDAEAFFSYVRWTCFS